MHRYFITGTDTEVGKTLVSAVLLSGLRSVYWKPIGSGASDTNWIQTQTNLPHSHFLKGLYQFKAPLSPHAAAALENKSIDLNQIHLPRCESILIEGAGGVLAPINDEHFIIDVIQKLDIPTILVSRSQLGTLNHTFLTLAALRQRKIPIAGVIVNGPKNPANCRDIEKFGRVKVLGQIEWLPAINSTTLLETFHERIQLC